MTLTGTPGLYLSHLLTPYTAKETAQATASACFLQQGTGYSCEQATRPQTLGYGLADSPVGLLAWIYEKLVDWSENYPWTDDEGMCPPSMQCWSLSLLDLNMFDHGLSST